MQKERISDNVYWFQSEVYAQVTAGVIIGPQWAILIDTLMPEETPEIKIDFPSIDPLSIIFENISILLL